MLIINNDCDFDCKVNALATYADELPVSKIIEILDIMRENGDADGANNFIDMAFDIFLSTTLPRSKEKEFMRDLLWHEVPEEDCDEIKTWFETIRQAS